MTNEQAKPSKARKITAWILVGILGLLFIFSAVMKLIGGPEIDASFSKYGIQGQNLLIGAGELIAAILFLIPRTSSLGILLLSAFMGGAIVTHMEHGEPYMMAAVIMVFMWFAEWLRHPDLMISFSRR